MADPSVPTGGTGSGATPKKRSQPTWVAPVVVLAVVATLVAVGRKKAEAVENPLVDIAILTVGVFAFAAAFRFIAVKLGSPGLATFFGAPAQSPTNS